MSGLTCNVSIIPVRIPIQSSCARYGRVSYVHYNRKSLKNMDSLLLDRKIWDGTTRNYELRQTHMITNAINASFGDMASDSNVVFPRINTKDPYKRLGISKEASEDEIQAARNFLINKCGGHKPSVDAIESAHDKIIMQKFHERRRPEFNIKKNVKDVTQPRVAIPAKSDPVYRNRLVNMMVNRILKHGKKSLAYQIIYRALKKIRHKTETNPLLVLRQAVHGVTPEIAVKARRVGGSTHQVPIEIGSKQGKALAIRWLLGASRKRPGRNMALKLSSELVDAAKGRGDAIRRKEETHKMAEANRAFAHFR
ncbi:hypothetical protein AQUCO_00100312v1 [Aquilegia coerulea]|uniref:Ribosomal protein S7 n=1 Tax=Aquilegia coerulea TaxID=218851 RepID=A0A2G5F9Y6_AQUCA|nr:hypothetical protein AQUCO_00100312v1 [Aquilegia coerulea]